MLVDAGMGFVRQAGAAVVLVIVTLGIQSAGIAVLIRWARDAVTQAMNKLSPWRAAVLMTRFITMTLVLHILQIVMWAGFYRWQCLPTWESSFYFSAASYSTAGYGDVLLPQDWRTLGPLESVIGVIMCGISVSVLFAIAVRLVENETDSPVIPQRRLPHDSQIDNSTKAASFDRAVSSSTHSK